MGSVKFILLTICVFTVIKAQEGYILDSSKLRQQQGYNAANAKNIIGKTINISGIAGEDYPNFYKFPKTKFNCDSQLFPGYYADPETNCQMYHICQPGGRKDSFLCANGTIFDQGRLVCEWWHSVDCSQARAKYSVNEAITKAMEEIDRRNAERKAAEIFQYYRPNSQNLGEVHDAQQPPQGYKNNNNVNSDRINSGVKVSQVYGKLGFSSINYPLE